MFRLNTVCYKTICRLYSVQTKKVQQLVPQQPFKSRIDLQKLPPRTELDPDTVTTLEKLSLVGKIDADNKKTVEDAVAFADQILQVDTSNVEPVFTVLEDCPLRVREDKVNEGNILKDLLKNANNMEEDYFVGPRLNVPLAQKDNKEN